MAGEKYTLDEVKLADNNPIVNALLENALERYKKWDQDKKNGCLGKLLRELEACVLTELNNIEDRIKPTSEEKTHTKLLHFLTFVAELSVFVFASIAIVFNPMFGIFALMTGIASILGIIAAFIECTQLLTRIIEIKKDRDILVDLVRLMFVYQQKREKQADNNKNNLKITSIQKPEFLAHWQARLERIETDLKRLYSEFAIAIIAILISALALTLLLTITINIELMLLYMILADKLVHWLFAVRKKVQAENESIPLQVIKESNTYIDGKRNAAEERDGKRSWKLAVRTIELLCIVLALCAAYISVNPMTMIILVATATVIDGGTISSWTIYHGRRYKNKKQLAAAQRANDLASKQVSSCDQQTDTDTDTDTDNFKQSNEHHQREPGCFTGTWCCLLSRKKEVPYMHHNSDGSQNDYIPASP